MSIKTLNFSFNTLESHVNKPIFILCSLKVTITKVWKFNLEDLHQKTNDSGL